MTVENIIRIIAGTVIIVSVAFVVFISHWWLILTVLVGVNLIQSAFTGFCPAEMVVRRLRADPDAKR
ncbi:MAG: DUF2892 domain-containing protein [Phycisphaerae bacterium]|nr:DUF2892 domain-containing protein [Phycisphaerae bacterium]